MSWDAEDVKLGDENPGPIGVTRSFQCASSFGGLRYHKGGAPREAPFIRPDNDPSRM